MVISKTVFFIILIASIEIYVLLWKTRLAAI